MDIYAQNILDRYKEPFYKDKPVKSDISGKQVNHSCGDNIEVQIELKDDKIENYSFSGVGCAISQAAADILGDLIIGQSLSEILTMKSDELIETLGIEISERRMKCALLALTAIKNTIKHDQNN